MAGRKWIVHDIQYLKRNYDKKSVKTIARKLRRTETAIKYKVYELGLTKKREDYSKSKGLGMLERIKEKQKEAKELGVI